MWGRLFAFGMLILIILAFIQFSTLSDSDVEKIRAQVEQIEAQKKMKQADGGVPESASSESLSHDNHSAENENPPAENSLVTEPSIIAYEAFLDAIPSMRGLADIDQYYIPSILDIYKQRLSSFSNDSLKGFKNLHDLQAMEYMKIQHIGDELAMITFIASNATTRMIADDKRAALAACQLLMQKDGNQWRIQDEAWYPQEHPAFEPYKSLLDDYHKKRPAS